MKTKPVFLIRFRNRAGCHASVLADMVRYDGATLLETSTDEQCHDQCFRTATIEMTSARNGYYFAEPHAQRWASFAVGATFEKRGEHTA